MKMMIKPRTFLFWSIVLGMAMSVLMHPLPPNSNLSARAQTQCIPPPAGMVGWWPGDGDANDIHGGHHGTLQNGATFAPGMVGQSFSLDGVDDYVSIDHDESLDGFTGATIDAWIKAEE